jgi:7,8-dihydroneopterin aldolase/epimerase/oxygenase
MPLEPRARPAQIRRMEQLRYADAARAMRHMFIRDLVLVASIGVYAHEHDAPQRVRINVDLAVTEEDQRLSRSAVGQDDLSRVVDYEAIVNRVRGIVAAGHVQLVETLAERLCEACLADPRVHTARVRVEKLDIFPDAAAAGVEVERRNRQLSTP